MFYGKVQVVITEKLVKHSTTTYCSNIKTKTLQGKPWRAWCARLDSNQCSRLPDRSELNGLHRRPTPYSVVVIRTSKKKPRFYAGFRYIPQIQRPFAKTVEVLGTPGLPRFFRFWGNSSQTVARRWTKNNRRRTPNSALCWAGSTLSHNLSCISIAQ